MGAFTIPFKSFAGGEISPDIDARTDQVKYQTGLAACRNFFTRLEGSASNRSGTGFVCPLIKFSAGPGRSIPFIFNDAQSYELLMHWTGTETRFIVIKNGAPLMVEPAFGVVTDLVSATSATPPVATTVDPHGYANGELVYLRSLGYGSAEFGDRWVQVQNVAASTFQLWEEAAIVGNAYTYVTGTVRARKVYSVSVPGVTSAQIADLRYSQSADVITLVCDGVPPFTISRVSETSWVVANVTFSPTISRPTNGALTGTAGAVATRYRVTAVANDTSEESFTGWGNQHANPQIDFLGTLSPIRITSVAHLYLTGDAVGFSGTGWATGNANTYTITVTGPNTFTLNGTSDGGIATSYLGAGFVFRDVIATVALTAPSAGNPITVTWTAVSGATTYNIYRDLNGVFSFIGAAVNTSFVDYGYTADPLDTPPVVLDYFNAAGKYPAAVGYYQQRLALGGPTGDPEECRVSRSGLFYNFTRSNPTQADDSIRWIMASGQVNGVRHFADMGKLLVFTQGAVFSIEGDDAGTLRPTAINPRKRADHGIGSVPPITVGSAAIYVQTSGKIVREIVPNGLDRYETRDLTSFAKHLFESYGITAWAYAEEPYGIVWGVRSDGTMLGLTYLKEHAVDGWHTHDTGNGDSFLDVSCIPENNESATYVLVSRQNCNGHTRTYCERMASRTVLTPRDGRFLDCFGTYDGRNLTPTSTYILHYDTTKSLDTLVSFTDFNTWTTTNATLDVNNAVSSAGATGGDTLTDDATNGTHGISSLLAVISGKTYTFEVVIAPGTETLTKVSVFDGVSHYVDVDLFFGSQFGNANLVSQTVSNAGLINGYWRVTIVFIATATTTATISINVIATPGGVYSYAGTGKTLKVHTAIVTGQTTLRYWIEPTGTAPTFSTADIAREVVFPLSDGTELRCTITGFNGSPNYAFVALVGNVGLLTLPYTSSSWALAVGSLGGLWHLNGRSVYCLGEGDVLGPFTVTNGRVTFTAPIYQAVIGLQIIADLETLEPDNTQGETWADKTKAMAELTLKVRNTLGVSVGLSIGQLQAFKERWCTPGKYVDGDLYTGKLQIINRATVTADGKVFVRQDQPLPVTVLGIYPRLEIGEV